MTRKELETIGELASKLTKLQDLDPELVRAAGQLWEMYGRNGGWEIHTK